MKIYLPGKLLCCAILVSCTKDIPSTETKVADPFLEINVSVEQDLKILKDSLIRIDGRITVINRTSEVQHYGNKFLIAIGNSDEQTRTYMDSPASHVIDFTTVPVQPSDTLIHDVYWMFSKSNQVFPISFQYNRMALTDTTSFRDDHRSKFIESRKVVGQFVGIEMGDYYHVLYRTGAADTISFFAPDTLMYFAIDNRDKEQNIDFNITEEYIREAGGYVRIEVLTSLNTDTVNFESWKRNLLLDPTRDERIQRFWDTIQSFTD